MASIRGRRLPDYLEKLVPLLLGGSIIVSAFAEEQFWATNAVLVAGVFVLTGREIARRLDGALGCVVAYCGVQGIIQAFFRQPKLLSQSAYVIQQLAFCASALPLLGLCAMGLYYLDRHQIRPRLQAFFLWIGPVNAVFTLGYWLITGYAAGFERVHSINSAIIAMTLPWVLWHRPILAVPMIAAVVVAHGSTGLLMLVVGLAWVGWYRARWLTLSALPVALVGVLLELAGKGADRSGMVVATLGAWWESARWFGNGIGSFYVWGPFIQQSVPAAAGSRAWVTLHCDWVQGLFELGLVGMVLVGWLFVRLAATAHRNRQPELLGCLLSWAVFACFYYPLRQPLPLAIMGCGIYLLLCRWTLED